MQTIEMQNRAPGTMRGGCEALASLGTTACASKQPHTLPFSPLPGEGALRHRQGSVPTGTTVGWDPGRKGGWSEESMEKPSAPQDRGLQMQEELKGEEHRCQEGRQRDRRAQTYGGTELCLMWISPWASGKVPQVPIAYRPPPTALTPFCTEALGLGCRRGEVIGVPSDPAVLDA